MQLGLNQNIKYKGEIFHVQTEDGGKNNPIITTLLFKSGTILASRRTSYEDILKSDQLESVVKEIMTEQHKGILKELINGKLVKGAGDKPTAKLSTAQVKPAQATPVQAEPAPVPAPKGKAPESEASKPEAAPAAAPASPKPAPQVKEVAQGKSLDDIILDRLSLVKKD
jgi:hypothetical protein